VNKIRVTGHLRDDHGSFRNMRGWRLLSWMAGFSLVCLAGAQAPSTPTSSSADTKINPQVVLRAETRLVQLNVIVQNKRGQPIEDLEQKDFTLLDNGKPQMIALFSKESAATPGTPDSTSGAGTSDAKNEPAPNVFGNRLRHGEERPGSVTVILLDALNTSFSDQAYARTQVLKFLRQLRPEDHVAIYLLTTRLTVVNEFTQDSKSLLAAIDRLQMSPSLLKADAARTDFHASDVGIPNFKGATRLANMMNDMSSKIGDIADVKRVQITSNAIESIANHVEGIPGRKNLIWVSGGFPISISLGSNRNSPVDRKSQTFQPQVDRVTRALNQSNLAIYPVDARGVLTNGEFDTSQGHPFGADNPAIDNTGVGQDGQSTMVRLAESTGGRAFLNTNDIKGAIQRTLGDSRVTYEISYYPDHGSWNGEYHSLELRVKKSGAALRYRKGYFALADPPSTTVETQDALRAATFSPVDATGLGITAKIKTIFPATRKVDMRVTVELADLRLSEVEGHHKGSVDAIFTQLADGDNVVSVEPLTYKLDFSPDDYQALLERGYQLDAPLTIKPSARVLRVVVRNAASGLLGSVTVPLERFLPTADSK
jgi:VWFA-related protein